MSQLKIVDTQQLEADLTAIADAIRIKTGDTEAMAFPDGFIDAVSTLGSGYLPEGTDIMELHLTDQLTSFQSEMTTSIKRYAFYESDTLEEVYFPQMSNIGAYAFTYCNGLRSVKMPSLELLNAGCFEYCTSLVEVYLPSIVSAANYSFHGCTSLAYLDAFNIYSIGTCVFQGCTLLTTLIIRRNSSVCKLDNVNSFAGTPMEAGTGYIYVPAALVDSYKAANNWSTYAAQFRAIEDYPDICGGVTE